MRSSETRLFNGVIPFVATAEARSFRVAARTLGLTPSAVSKAVARLEADVGARLLHRTSRSVVLTEEGAAFLKACLNAMDAVRHGREDVVQSQKTPQGRLTVSLPLLLGRRVVLPALPRFLSRHPAISVRVVLTDRFVNLQEENVDVALRVGSLPDSRVVARKVRAVRWMTVASPEYLARMGTPSSPSELAGHHCLKFMLPNGIVQEWVFGRRDGSEGESFSQPTEAAVIMDDGDSLIDAAIAGLGILQAHDYAVEEAVSRGKLVRLLTGFDTPGPAVSLLTPRRKAPPKARAFTQFVLELLAA